MKKVISILLLSLVFCGEVTAQTFDDSHKYGFWSNWSLGAGVQYSKNFTDNWKFGEGSNLGIDCRAQKQLSRVWDLRLVASIPGFITSDSNMFDRYGTALIGFSWTPKNHFYLFADGGIGCKRSSYNWLALAADAGVGIKYNVCKHSTIFGEVGMDCVADFTENMSYNNVFARVGWMYRFGMSKSDKIMAEQRKLLEDSLLVVTKEHEREFNRLKVDNSNLAKSEQRLLERISTLEKHDIELSKSLDGSERVSDSLRGVIENICNDQLNYYALPFSVLFDNDSYEINPTEMLKLKAIASIMKDNQDIHYSVVGFCDQTGSANYNKKLSEKRAEAVKKTLLRLGVSEDQINISGNGYDTPFSDGKLEVNRRVSFYRDIK